MFRNVKRSRILIVMFALSLMISSSVVNTPTISRPTQAFASADASPAVTPISADAIPAVTPISADAIPAVTPISADAIPAVTPTYELSA